MNAAACDRRASSHGSGAARRSFGRPRPVQCQTPSLGLPVAESETEPVRQIPACSPSRLGGSKVPGLLRKAHARGTKAERSHFPPLDVTSGTRPPVCFPVVQVSSDSTAIAENKGFFLDLTPECDSDASGGTTCPFGCPCRPASVYVKSCVEGQCEPEDQYPGQGNADQEVCETSQWGGDCLEAFAGSASAPASSSDPRLVLEMSAC